MKKNKEKNKILFIIISLIILVLTIVIVYKLLFSKNNIEAFYLEDKYYESNSMEEVDYKSVDRLMKNKENFIVFLYQPSCIVSADFESILNGFLKENQVKILKLSFSEIKDTKIGKKIDFYPSFIIFNKGKIIDYLDVNSDDDISYFTSKDEFKNWLTTYVKLKDIEVSNSDENNQSEEDINIDNINLDYIAKEENKVNVYFFWGDGCPHCEHAKEFFKDIQNQEQYDSIFNIYSFETWYNKDNEKIMKVFAKAMNEEAKGVPYIIIGNKTFKGFGEKSKESITLAITDDNNRNIDVYFDKIKNNSTQS